MKKYRVTYEYTATISVDVEADDKKEAEHKGLQEADELVGNALSVSDVWVSESTT